MVEETSPLIAGALVHDVTNNGKVDFIAGSNGSNAYRFSAGQSGDDTITQFSSRDTLLTDHRIYDANNDGLIGLGANHVLDIDRVSRTDAGRDQITLRGLSSNALRFLGSKDGSFVYADAATRHDGWIEGTVGDDRLLSKAISGTHDTFFFDTALGLNLGHDVLDRFVWSDGDLVVTTSPLTYFMARPDDEGLPVENPVYDRFAADQIGDMVIDMYYQTPGTRPGVFDLSSMQQEVGTGGTIQLNGFEHTVLVLSQVEQVGQNTYYYYHGYPDGDA